MKVTRPPAPVPFEKLNDATPAVRDKMRPDPLMEVSKKFEAIFVNEMVSSMRKTVARGGLIPESHAEKVYQSMLDYEHSVKIAESGQLGLSNMIYEHLLRTQNRR